MLQPKCSEETHEKEQKRKDKQAHQLCRPATGRAVHTKHILSASIGGVMIKLEEDYLDRFPASLEPSSSKWVGETD